MIAGHATSRALVSRAEAVAVSMLDGSTRTGAELDDRIARLAASFDDAGFTGRRVGIWYQNSLQAVESHLALERIGAARVPIDPGAPASEAERVFRLTGVVAVVTDGDRQVDAEVPTVVHSADADFCGTKGIVPREVGSGQMAVLFARATTEDVLIGVPMTYANWEASIAHNSNLYRSDWYGPAIDGHDVFLNTQQILHGTSIIGLMPFLRMELPQVLVDQFDAAAVTEAIDRFRITSTFMVPAMIARLVDSLSAGRRITGLKRLLYGGAPMSLEDMEKAMDALGSVLVQHYGKWDGGWPLTVLTQGDHDEIVRDRDKALATSCGRVAPGVELSLRPVPGHPEGAEELWVRSPMVILEQADPEGWYELGDLAKRDADGYYYLQGRLDGMINTGAFHVYPAEIEAALSNIDGVDQAVVRGEPDPKWGQIVTAQVTWRPDIGPLAPDEIRDHLATHLARYKLPKRIEVLAGNGDRAEKSW